MRTWLLGLGAPGVACAALAIGACGGDDNGGGGGGKDASADQVVGADATTDQGTQDHFAQDQTSQDQATNDAPPFDAGLCQGYDASGLDEASVALGLDAVLNFGKCYACHQTTPAEAGITLSGNPSTIVAGGMVYPPNLTPDRVNGLGCWTDPEIDNAILNAVDRDGGDLCRMPKWATRGMDAGTAANIREYLRSLKVAVNAVPESVCTGGGDGGGEGGGGNDGGDAGATDGAASDAASDVVASDAGDGGD